MKKSNTGDAQGQSKPTQTTTPAAMEVRGSDQDHKQMSGDVQRAFGQAPELLPIEMTMLRTGRLSPAVETPGSYVRIRRQSAQLLFDLTS